MTRRFDYEKAATILAESYFSKLDEPICRRWGIHRKTLWGYRKRLLDDPLLQHKVSVKRRQLQEKWTDRASEYLLGAINAIDELTRIAVEKEDPKMISEIVNAVKVIGELAIAKQALFEEDEPTNYQQSPVVETTARET